MEYFMMR